MSQTHPNYMNGVPVKISEKYKPPIKIQINQNISQRLANVGNDISQLLAANYEFSLEKNVLTKLSEWERVRQQENCDRKERIRRRQEEQQRHIEQKQKQMLTAVSYPSADDLSSDEDDEHESSNDSTTTMKTSSTENESTTNTVTSTPGHFSPPNCFDNILIPTVIPEQLLNNRMPTTLAPKFNKINYSDFENTTSSPFDNVELQTINDLDILAQVLNIKGNVNDEAKSKKANQITQNEFSNQKQENASANIPSQMNASDYHQIYHAQQQSFPVQYPLVNNYYESTARFAGSNQPQINQNAYNYVPQPYSNEHHALANKSLTYQLSEYSNPVNSFKTVKNEYLQYQNGFNGRDACSPQQQQQLQLYHSNFVNTRNYSQGPNNKLAFQTQQPEIPNKSKSKSVPDIVQELNNELKNSERLRNRNNSQSSVNIANDDDYKTLEQNLVNNKTKNDDQTKENSDKFYRNLSVSSQKLAKNISSMGFPLEIVSRITEKFGKDDKKIVEHLIPLNELLDLGFDENKISEALIKFDNDKEKALDYLIS